MLTNRNTLAACFLTMLAIVMALSYLYPQPPRDQDVWITVHAG